MFLTTSRNIAAACTAVSICASLPANAQSYTVSTIATFAGGGYDFPSNITVDNHGNLFGTTFAGGASNDGTVFEVAAGASTVTTLATFSGANGIFPQSGITFDSQGNLYGTAQEGGANNDGLVFRIAAGTNNLTTFATFSGANGSAPESILTLDSSGDFYGTTYDGGANNDGTVFKIGAGTNTVTTVASFAGINGEHPTTGVALDNQGNLFGTTSDGGTLGYGSIFEIAAGTSTITTLASLTSDGVGFGSNPATTPIVDSHGNVFGTVAYGGSANYGFVYEIAAGTSTVSTLASFTLANGAFPIGALSLDSHGNLYGTTGDGGTYDQGTAFELMAGTNTLKTLATFSGPEGSYPGGGLTSDGNGNFYGTTDGTGSNEDGTVFKLSAAGTSAPEPASLTLLTLATTLAGIRRSGRKAA